MLSVLATDTIVEIIYDIIDNIDNKNVNEKNIIYNNSFWKVGALWPLRNWEVRALRPFKNYYYILYFSH